MKGNLSFASEDIRRMIESRFDKVSLADAGQLTDSAALRAAVDEAVHELWVARTELVDSALAVAREVGETGEARDGLADVSSTSTAEWQYVRFEVERGLLNPLPEARPDAATMARRRKLFGELFALTDGDFSRLTSARKVEVLQGVVALVAQAPHHKVLGAALVALITQRLGPVAGGIEAWRASLQREMREDREVYQRLFAARTAFDLQHSALVHLVQAALTRGGRIAELGLFVRAHDPAYRARRIGGQAVKLEEGIEAVTAELGTTPDAIAEPS